MSAIDCIWHEVIGQLDGVPIYRLIETPSKGYGEFGDAREGDILLGGGSGETPALRISMPEALEVYTCADYKFDYSPGHRYDNEVEEHWGVNHGYERIKRYRKIGYRGQDKDGWIESWLACHILDYVVKLEPKRYKQFLGTIPLLGLHNSRLNLVSPAPKEWVDMAKDWFKERNKRRAEYAKEGKDA